MASYAYIGTNADQSWQLDTVLTIYEKSLGKVELIIETSDWLQLDKLMQRLSSGDLLMISDLSQLSGTSFGVLNMLTTLIGIGVTVTSVEEGGAVDPNILLFIRSIIDEITMDRCPLEEPLTEQRKRKGRPTGSRLDIHSTAIQRLLVDGLSHTAIAGQFNISRQSFKEFVKSRGLLT